jgi:hypothetical protein
MLEKREQSQLKVIIIVNAASFVFKQRKNLHRVSVNQSSASSLADGD